MDFPQRVKYLVFSGGAAKGYAHLGVLNVLDNVLKLYSLNLIDHVEGYGGSSFGAIVAVACSLGVDLNIVQSWFMRANNNDMLANVDLVNFLETKGLVRNEFFMTKLDELLAERFGMKTVRAGLVTLSYMYQRTRKELKIVVSNATTGDYEVWDHVSHPDMEVKTALMASAAIPCIFEPVLYNGQVYMDGGLIHNFPIELFPASKVLGVRLLSSRQLTAQLDTCSTLQYVAHVLALSNSHSERYYIASLDPEYRERIITVHIPHDFSPMDLLNPSAASKKSLVQLGEKCALTYFIESVKLADMMDTLRQYFGGIVSSGSVNNKCAASSSISSGGGGAPAAAVTTIGISTTVDKVRESALLEQHQQKPNDYKETTIATSDEMR